MAVLFFFLAMFHPVDTCPSMEHYLNLSIHFDKDTTHMGDILTLTVEFRNKTDKNIEFYPECYQALTQPVVFFGIDETLILNDANDYVTLINLPPDSTYNKRVTVKSSGTFLHYGLNRVYMFYRCPELKGKSGKKYNKLCGKLKSNEIILYVTQ
jgi:hypothetical protein